MFTLTSQFQNLFILIFVWTLPQPQSTRPQPSSVFTLTSQFQNLFIFTIVWMQPPTKPPRLSRWWDGRKVLRGGGKINVHIRSDGEGVYGMGKGGGYLWDKLTHTHPPQPQPVLQTAGGVRPCRRNRYTHCHRHSLD